MAGRRVCVFAFFCSAKLRICRNTLSISKMSAKPTVKGKIPNRNGVRLSSAYVNINLKRCRKLLQNSPVCGVARAQRASPKARKESPSAALSTVFNKNCL